MTFFITQAWLCAWPTLAESSQAGPSELAHGVSGLFYFGDDFGALDGDAHRDDVSRLGQKIGQKRVELAEEEVE